jgi:hypothetical protein
MKEMVTGALLMLVVLMAWEWLPPYIQRQREQSLQQQFNDCFEREHARDPDANAIEDCSWRVYGHSFAP